MEKAVEERFERIDRTLDRITERMDRQSEGHVEMEAAQKNMTLALTRFIDETRTRGKEVDDRIANLTILVDRLIERNLGRS